MSDFSLLENSLGQSPLNLFLLLSSSSGTSMNIEINLSSPSWLCNSSYPCLSTMNKEYGLFSNSDICNPYFQIPYSVL